MLHHGWCCEEWPNDGTPLPKCSRFPKTHRMVFQGVPENLQQVTFGALNTAVNLVTLESLGVSNNFIHPALNCLLKGLVLSGVDANVGEFKNHGAVFPVGIGKSDQFILAA